MPTEEREDKRYIFAAITQIEQVGATRLLKLRKAFSEPEEIFSASKSALLQTGVEERVVNIFLEKRKTIDVERFREKLISENIRIVLPEDLEYPALLREIPDLPQVLFVRGNLSAMHLPLAVVGTRKMSPYGRSVTEQIVGPLTSSGVSIISGLALGIDAIAHKTALESCGHTVAVLGTGCDDVSIYPASNQSLAARILNNGGAVISEFPPGTIGFKHHFPIRNRIIAGMTLATLVTEADINSGSLITARAALDYNRDVFAVPGDINRETARGVNNLIKLGARLVSSSSDIGEILEVNLADKNLEKLPLPEGPEEAAVILSLKREPKHIDAIRADCGLDISSVSATLSILEMKGSVRHVGGMHYVLAR